MRSKVVRQNSESSTSNFEEETESNNAEANAIKETERGFRTAMYQKMKDAIAQAAQDEIEAHRRYACFEANQQSIMFNDDSEDNGVEQDLELFGLLN